MRIFTRYLLREVVSHAALGLLLFTFVIFLRDLAQVLELVVRNSAPLPGIAEIFFLTLPTAFTITMPMAVLVGILIGLSRLASDSEITAMRASGVGAWAIVRILVLFAGAALAFCVWNNLYLAPKSAYALDQLQNSLKSSQASFEIQPRVFYEDLNNYVLYVEDVQAKGGRAVWKNVLLADLTEPQSPKLTLAKQAVVVQAPGNALRLHLMDGEQHESSPRDPQQYQISTFSQTDIPIQLPQTEPKPARDLLPVAQLSTAELYALARDSEAYKARWYSIELQRRLATTVACLVFALVGIPLGMSSKRGGKSNGFVLTIVLVFLYYVISLLGLTFARQGTLPVIVGVWAANGVFAIVGVWLLYRVNRSSLEVLSLASITEKLKIWWSRRRPPIGGDTRTAKRPVRKRYISRFPQIIDDYILKSFTGYLLLTLSSFLLLMLVFTFFELLRDVLHNRIPFLVVGKYLLNVIPYLLYQLTPLSVLIAVLVTFTLFQRSNELTAMKATGISLYRAIIPVLIITAAISALLFAADQSYLPIANRRQEALRNTIKGKPPQTVLRADHRWIFGAKSDAGTTNIYYYDLFDPDRNQFGNLNVFEIDDKSFTIKRRIFASHAHFEPEMRRPMWVLESGWVRSFAPNDGRVDAIAEFHTFDADSFPELREQPSYFKKEVKQSSEMSFGELRQYIADLQQSGFEVMRLRVQLYKKIAYPLITLVMSVLAIPFAVGAGRKAALTGIATAVGLAVVYQITSGLFEAMGNVSYLPPLLAAGLPDILFALVGGYLMLRVQT